MNTQSLFTYFSIFLICVILFFPHAVASSVSFTYDTNGNRISRSIVLEKTPIRRVDIQNDSNMQEATKHQAYTDSLPENPITISTTITEEIFAVKFSDMPVEKSFLMEIFSLDGINILRETASNQYYSISLSTLPAGVYIIRVSYADISKTWKLIHK